ncbi:MAG: hexose kinase [Actinomycetota bacterium]|nr:hexose kinase [Actinomycetota bacterium]
MLILNPNVCVDRTVVLGELVPGNVHRTGRAATTLGGKGVNVARVARALAQRASIVGFLPRADARRLETLASGEGAELVGVETEGDARVATILLESSGRVTVLNEPGAEVDARGWDALLEQVRARRDGHATLVCSGSLPPGSPLDAYARAVRVGRSLGMATVVDATGPVLEAALDEGPDVVSPNLSEAEAVLFGRTEEVVEPTGPDVVERAARAANELVRRGAARAIVSAGSHGAAFTSGASVAWCAAPEVRVVNPIGAGDSLVGGLVRSLEAGEAFDSAVRFALAVASASCEQPLAGGVDAARVRELLGSLGASELVGTGRD